MNHLTFLFSSVALIIPDLSHQVLNSRKELLKHTHIQRFSKTSWTAVAYYSKGCDSENLFADLAVSDTVTEGLTI